MNGVMKFVEMAAVALACVSVARAEVVIETVTVGNPGNANDTHQGGYGRVDYVYRIGKFEVTAGQYAEFLNAVAATDTFTLYSALMDARSWGCQITRHGTSGNFTYDFSGGTSEVPGSTAADWENRPVNFVSWGDAARFCNWLHNGQPTGAQDLTTTEDGSYYLNGATTHNALSTIVRELDATWVIPSRDEWYKAAYHRNNGVTGHYWDYPTGSNVAPYPESPPGTDMINGSGNWSGYILNIPYYRTEAGAYDAKPSDSPYGTFDQGGNLWEWTETTFSSSDSRRAVHGGGWDCMDVSNPPLCGIYAGYAVYEYADQLSDMIGFRVADGPPTGACCDGLSGSCTEGLLEEDCQGEKQVWTLGQGCQDVSCVTIPAASEWGLVVLALLTLTGGSVVLTRRRAVAA